MKKNYPSCFTFLLLMAWSFAANAQVIITEIAAPWDDGSCRYLELYNPSDSDIDFSDGWTLDVYHDGSSTADEIELTGIIKAHDYYIICRKADDYDDCYTSATCDQGSLDFDAKGDESYVLKDEYDSVLDMYGKPGSDGSGTSRDFEDGRVVRKYDRCDPIDEFDLDDWYVCKNCFNYDPEAWEGAATCKGEPCDDCYGPQLTYCPDYPLELECGYYKNEEIVEDWLSKVGYRYGCGEVEVKHDFAWHKLLKPCEYYNQNPYRLKVTWTAEDECGNKDYCHEYIKIYDRRDPYFVYAPGDLELECNRFSVEYDIKPWLQQFKAEDWCDDYVDVKNDFDKKHLGKPCQTDDKKPFVLKVKFTATDDCGNYKTIERKIIIDDTKDPYVHKQGEDKDMLCTEPLDFDTPEFKDICDDYLDVDFKDETYFTDCCNITRTWTATDDCGNTATAEQTIHIIDDVPPVLTPIHPLLKDLENGDTLVFECGEGVPFIAQDVVANDECESCPSGDIEVKMDDAVYPGNCVNAGFSSKMECWWEAYDRCGNRAIFSIWIISYDTKGPEFTFVPADKTIECNGTPEFGIPTAVDNCEVQGELKPVTIEAKDQTIVKSNKIEYIRTWTATDFCGNTSTASQIITAPTGDGPVFSNVPADVTLGCTDPFPTDAPTAKDGCTGQVLSLSLNELVDGNTTIRTWSATSDGETASVSQRITVEDNKAPSFTFVPADETIACETLPVFGTPTATDDCGAANILAPTDEVSGDCKTGIVHTRTWTAIDGAGNTTTATQSITVEADTEAPVFTFVPESGSIDCGADPSMGMATATDNCTANVTVTFVDNHNDTGCDGGSFLRTFTATDKCGNSSTATQMITRTADDVAPVFTFVPKDREIDCNDDFNFLMATATDNCGTVDVDVIQMASFSVCPGGIIVRTFTATDACGNTTTAEQLITVLADITPPTFTFIPASRTVSCGGDLSLGMATAEDNCSGDNVNIEMYDDGAVDPCTGGTITRIFVATDACGRVSTAEQTITAIPDEEAPVFTSVPPDMTITCGDPIDLGMPTATDDCEEVNITFTDAYNTENRDCENGFYYDIFRTWTATDACGNSTTTLQSAWIVAPGYSGPQFAFIPESRELACGERNEFGEPVCTTSCGLVKLTHEDFANTGDCADGSSYTRVWTAVDDCGNTATASQTLTLPPDTEAPVFENFLSEKTISCGEQPQFDTPICIDNCTGEQHIVVTHKDEAQSDGCSFSRTWTAVDLCGNEARATQTIYRLDNEAPVFSFVPENQEVDCDGNLDFTEARAADDCGTVSMAFSDALVEVAGGMQLTRTWMATDACGNVASVSRSITQMDKTAPVFTTVLSNKTITCGEAFSFETPAATDACSEVQLQFTDETEATACNGLLQVTRRWTAIDNNGNQSVTTQRITQVDETAPVFSFVPADVEVPCGETTTFGEARVEDACGQISLVFADEVQTATATRGQIISRKWTATDACGNVAYATQRLIFELDIEAPVFTKVPEAQTINCSDNIEFGQPEASDNCSSVSISYEDQRTSGDCSTGYSFTRVWTATDANGNSSTAAQSFTVASDKSAPVFSVVPEDLALSCGEAVAFSAVEAADNCSNANITFTDAFEMQGVVEVHTRTWTATDDCGNSSTARQVIRLSDEEAPNITFTPTDKSISCGEALSFDTPVAVDNCSDVSMLFEDEATVADCGTRSISRKWTITDASGNSAFAKQTITEMDNTAPIFEELPAAQQFSCGESMEIAAPVVSDACSEVTVSFEDEAISNECSSGYQFRRVWTATDACGNVAIASQEFSTAPDDSAPVFLTALDDKTVGCGEALSFDTPQVSDNCSAVDLNYDDMDTPTECGYTRIRTWTALDQCGNASTLVQRVHVVDEEAPVFVNVPTELRLTYAEFNNWTLGDVDLQDACSEVSLGEV
ncbi:MAG: lamin tail domain-containing protein, partial [Bacteroidota bacterium]